MSEHRRQSWYAKAKAILQTQKSQHPSLSGPESSHYKPNNFCAICTRFFSELSVILSQTDDEIRSTDYKTFPTHKTIKSLLQNADQKCHLCSLILGTAWLDGDSSFSQARKRLLNCYSARHPPLNIRIHGNKLRSHETQDYSHIYTSAPDAGVLSLDAGLGTGPLISIIPNGTAAVSHSTGAAIAVTPSERQPLCNSTGDRESLSLAKYWIDKCRNEHEECNKAIRNAMKVRPARILRLEETSADPKVLLVTLEETAEVPEYLALSYSWGPNSANTTRLLVSNIDSFGTQGVSFQILPQTIKDAITTTISLGYRYLWVDALCIIQDSPNKTDWNAEAGKMGAVYRNAVCTIAALGCRGNHERLFRERNPLCDRPCEVPNTGGKWQISNTAHYFFREYEHYGPTAAPLHTRAWVVQERISSVRTLFFGQTGLFWECTQIVASESDPDGSLDPPGVNFKRNINEVLRPEMDQTGRYVAFRNLWRQILEQYTLCNLTHQSDKLIGIKGIIELISKVMGWENCQGLWVNILQLDMAWKSNIEGRIEDGNKGGRARNGVPSWSWGSVKQSVTCVVKSEKYTVATAARFGPSIVGYPNPGGVPIVEIDDLPQGIKAALRERPQDCISLMTSLKKVWIIHATRSWSKTGLLTLEEPMERQVWKDIATHGQRKGKDTDGVVEEWEWTPDVPLDKSLRTAWFMNLLDTESHDGRKIGVVGLILSEIDLQRRVFERIGILMHKVFKSEDLSDEVTFDENGKLVTSKRSLGPSPFARSENLISLVHIT